MSAVVTSAGNLCLELLATLLGIKTICGDIEANEKRVG